MATAKSTTKPTREQQRELARLLYTREGKTFVELAEAVGVSRQTISKWAAEDRWEDYKLSISLTQEERLKSTYRQLAELDRLIESRPEGQRYPTSKESDARKKLTASINDLQSEIGIQEVISVCSKLLTWLRSSDLDETKRIAPILDNFIKSQL